MSENFRIMVDSSCDLPLELCEKLNILTIKMHYAIDDDIFVDTMIDSDCKNFYQKMRDGKVPHSSQINTENFIQTWKELFKEDSSPIIYISLGSEISGTYFSAVKAAETLKEEDTKYKIFVVNSAAACLAHGLLALKAAELRNSGKSCEECVAWLEDNKHTVNTFYTTDTLTYFYRSGRVSKTGMIISKALGINPILNLNYEGKLIVVDKARGKKQTIKSIVQKIKDTVIEPENQTFYVGHADALDEALEFVKEIKKEIKFKDVYYTFIGPTIGSNCGPGVKAFFYFGKTRN